MSDDDILFDEVGDAWRATLPNGKFDPDLTLSDAGVDSLEAMELVLRIERPLDCKIPYALLTTETTPRALAAPAALLGKMFEIFSLVCDLNPSAARGHWRGQRDRKAEQKSAYKKRDTQ